MKQQKARSNLDKTIKYIMVIIILAVFIFFAALFIMLLQRSQLILSRYPVWELLFSSEWDPNKGLYGFLPAVTGTFFVTVFSLMIAVPISILSAVYISEYMPSAVKSYFQAFIDVLAGVPSVVFGLCALLVLVPFTRDVMGPLFGVNTTGMCVFTAALVLAAMVFPVIISLTVESLSILPIGLREQFLSLGATKWQLIETVLFRAAGPGIISGIILGFGKAFGETMAVVMVIGNKNILIPSVFSPGQTLPGLIVGSFSEMMSVPEHQSALIFVSLILFIIVLFFNILANIIKNKLKSRWRYE
jgi:phosphate transport system permease protein